MRTLAERAINISLLKPSEMRQAVVDARKATEIDPLSAWAGGMYAFVLAFDDQKAHAVEKAKHAVGLD